MAMVGRGKEEEAAARDARQRRRASRGRGEREKLGDIEFGEKLGKDREERRRRLCRPLRRGGGEVRKEEGKRERERGKAGGLKVGVPFISPFSFLVLNNILFLDLF
jgi:hypothetical protein